MGYPPDESGFANAVRKELERARGEAVEMVDAATDDFEAAWVIPSACPRGKVMIRRPGFPALHSAHEAYAVILEELDEFWDEVRKKGDVIEPAKMLKELIQVSAMAQRAAEDLGLISRG